MANEKVPMPQQDGNVRNKNFDEVTLGYTKEMAMEEAKRCLDCKHKPCVNGCPVNVRIPEFVKEVAYGEFERAFEIITSTNSLPAVCGRVCPQESQCEEKCVRGIKGEPVAIGRLERFVADWYMANVKKDMVKPASLNKKVAVLGAGPSGLTCASDLAKLGYEITVFEAFHTIGGVLIYGIPEFRLPKAIVKKEVDNLKSLGVKFELNTIAGRAVSIEELKEDGFEAIYVATGAGLPSFMGIEGEGLKGVYSANEYLTRINLMKAYVEGYETPIQKSKSVAIVGGGNVAMDAARCAKRVGAENVYIVYRRDKDNMPARHEEIHHAEEEEIELQLLTNPLRVVGDEEGKVVGLECIKMELGEPDESGRRSPKAIEGSNFILEVDTVIMSIGTSPNPLLADVTEGLDRNKKGCIIVDDKMETTLSNVYAGGDATVGAATVIYAMGCGKVAAKSIHDALSK
ncbi:MAG: NADPH-dependent glutamate synthase [Lachnospirales bacterium]